MEKDKYEYLLHTWGGFYNKEHQDKHGFKDGFFFFDTAKEREQYLKKLREIETTLHANVLVAVFSEGTEVRYKTIVKAKMLYKDKTYDVTYDYGYAYPEENAEYMFYEGNYSCDCNRSLFIKEKYPEFKELLCGHEIEMIEFEIVKEK